VSQEQKWPDILWIIRHGESAGNVALREALAAGLPVIDLSTRDMDVPLSARGEEQARALGQWFRRLPLTDRPTVILSSPYLRARRTAELLVEAAGLTLEPLSFLVDERLREKEFGILDRLTSAGIAAQYPEQADFRRFLGKFYHRPPGGESWCDVLLRLRSVIDLVRCDYRRERVAIVCHTVVVLCLRYLLEQMSEEQILAIDRLHDIANCSVTSYVFDPQLGRHGHLALQLFNFVAPLAQAGAPITTTADTNVPE
jgi:2,3-bisphosphoglycerate-dependent phosphoglycerate mutase